MKFVILILAVLLSLGGAHSQIVQPTNEAENLYQLALVKNQEGLLIQASALLTQAISLDKQQSKYFYQRGLSFFGMDEVTHGIKDFNTAVDLKTLELGVYIKLIQHYMDNNQYLAVLIITDQLAANIPDQAAGAFYDKGRAYEAMNKGELAILAYQSSLNNLDESQHDFKQLLQEKINKIEDEL